MFRRLIITVPLAVLLCAQPAASPITADLRAEYWQVWGDDADARRILAEAQIAAFQKRQNLALIIEKLRKTCMDSKQQLSEGPDRQPICILPASSAKGTR